MRASASRICVRSRRSRSKVRSRDSEMLLRAAPTSRLASKRVRRRSSRPRFGPKRSTSACSGAAETAASVCSPRAASAAAVFGPMPGTSAGERPAKRSHACSRVSTTKPAGFSASEATFATSLLGPIPTEHVSCVARLISTTSRRMAARGLCRPSSARYASSSPTTSTRSTCARTTSIIVRETWR